MKTKRVKIGLPIVGVLILSGLATIALAATNLHSPHVGASSETFERECEGNESLNEGEVLWHFVLTQTTAVNSGELTAVFENDGTIGPTSYSKHSGKVLHWNIITSGHDVLESASTTADGNSLLLSHVCFEEPEETPTPETETPTPETPTATPETETPTPETETPSPTPETPSPTPETPTATPETETPTPETPSPTPKTVTPTETPTEPPATPTMAKPTDTPSADSTPVAPTSGTGLETNDGSSNTWLLIFAGILLSTSAAAFAVSRKQD